MSTASEIPVLVVGAGPAGLATALSLGTHGVRSIVCEQFGGINPHPRAHVLNLRSMELLHRWGVAQTLDQGRVDATVMHSIQWRATIAGEEFGRVDFRDTPLHQQLQRDNASAQENISCAQDIVQRRMLEAVHKQGMAEVRFDTRVTGLTQSDDRVQVELSTHHGSETVSAAYVVAADGASGGTRSRLGIDMEGIPAFGHQINVYFHADLSRWVAEDPALIYWVLNTEAPSGIISMDGGRRWTYNADYDPNRETVADYPPDRCADLIRKAAGVDDLDVDVKSVGTWTLAARTAERYRQGRVFLAGDAAHQFPPTGGLGMNTGITDADNLGWKLAAVLQGWAGEALLDTYERERRPVAVANADMSVTNAMNMAEAGLGPATVEVAARLESPDPEVRGSERARLAEVIPQQRPHFDSLIHEIGHVYDVGSGPELRLVDTATVGARLPHAWFLRNGERVSSLDLLSTEFTLVTSPEGARWSALFAGSRLGSRVPWRSLVIGQDARPEDADPFGVLSGGAVLVRPDGHVAWCADAPAPADADPDSVFPATLCPSGSSASSAGEGGAVAANSA